MKNITFDQFKQTYDNLKSLGLYRFIIEIPGLLSAYIIIRVQAFGMQYIYNYRHTLHKEYSTDYNNCHYFRS